MLDMDTNTDLTGQTVRLRRDRRRKWRVIRDEGQYLVIANGTDFNCIRKRVLRRVVVTPNERI
jgi:hypothetical protein